MQLLSSSLNNFQPATWQAVAYTAQGKPHRKECHAYYQISPHAVVTYYNGSHEAVAVDFTPTLSFDLDAFEHEADRRGAIYLLCKYSAKVWRCIVSLSTSLTKICAGIVS